MYYFIFVCMLIFKVGFQKSATFLLMPNKSDFQAHHVFHGHPGYFFGNIFSGSSSKKLPCGKFEIFNCMMPGKRTILADLIVHGMMSCHEKISELLRFFFRGLVRASQR